MERKMEVPRDYMYGKICMITGASSGIGKITALELAKLGATVVIVCRDRNRGEAARSEIQSTSGNQSVELLLADLSEQRAIRQLAQDFLQRYQQLHVLVNNAGVALNKRIITEDGLEKTFAVNYLAYFLLTHLLLDVLKASTPARIVNVSSNSQAFGSIHFDDLQGEKHYSIARAYCQSKLAVVYFTYELPRRLDGTGVTVNCLHPGQVATNMNYSVTGLFGLLGRVVRPFALDPERGARTSIYLASSPEVEDVTGKYFVKCKQARSSRISYDEFVSQRLWKMSEELTKLNECMQ